MTNGTRVIEANTDYVGTVTHVYTNTLGNVMVYVQFDTVGAIDSWAEWIPVDLLRAI